MIISKRLSQCDGNSIYFTEQSHNSANNSTFSRIMVCDSNSIINGLYIRLPFHDVDIHEINDWGVCKQVAQYCIDDECNTANAGIVSAAREFESSVLQTYKNTFNVCANKTQCHHIADTLRSGNLKLGGGESQTTVESVGDNDHPVMQMMQTTTAPPQPQDQMQGRISMAAVKILLKISGVWETDKMFGITFKYVTTIE